MEVLPCQSSVTDTQSHIPRKSFPTRGGVILARSESSRKDMKLKITQVKQEKKPLHDQLHEQQDSAAATAATPATAAAATAGAAAVPAEREKEKIASLQSELKAVGEVPHYRKQPQKAVADTSSSDSECEEDYFVPYSSPPHHDYVGLALIISNRFNNGKYPELDERTCAKDEERLLYKTLYEMGYAVLVRSNLSAQNMTKCFNEFQQLILKQDHSFACCILSHGGCDENGQDFIYGSDGGRFYPQKEARKTFSHCDALRGKHKLFISQACRGYELPVVSDPSQPSPYSGFSFLSSTTPGQVSLRRKPPRGAMVNQVDDNVSGRMYESPFISVLCESLRCYHHTEDISSIFRRVIQKLQTDKEGIGKYGGHWVRPCPELITTHGETVFVCT